jgi:ribonuclease Z
VPLASGESYPLGRDRTLEAFAVTHVPPEAAVGYRVLEMRHRLRPEHADLPADQIERRARAGGREQLMEPFAHVLFAHSGDAMPITPDLARDADVLVHDATFLGHDERRALIHATSEEALQVARYAAVRVLILTHLSIRYDRATAIPRLRDQVLASGFGGECWLLDEGEFVDLKT